MSRNFLETFFTLQLEDDLKEIAERLEIEKLAMKSNHELCHIYVTSDYLIEKQYFHRLEKELEKQLSEQGKVVFHIFENFHLSSQYHSQYILEQYENSILYELKEYDIIVYNLYKQSHISFPAEDHMILQMKNHIIAQNYGKELVRVLEKILCDRCSMKLHIDLEYVDMEVSQGQKEANAKLKLEIEHASTVANSLRSEEKPENQEKVKNKPEKKSYKKKEYVKKPASKDLIYGRDFEDEPMDISAIVGEMGEVCIRGKIIKADFREIRNEKTIVILTLTDFTDSIVLKIFTKNEQLEEIKGRLKEENFIKVKGISAMDKFDHEISIGSINGIKEIPDFQVTRMDHSPNKRVELHCHTKMSDMDGVSDVGDLVKRAISWGHSSIAITDHGAVQAFLLLFMLCQRIQILRLYMV